LFAKFDMYGSYEHVFVTCVKHNFVQNFEIMFDSQHIFEDDTSGSFVQTITMSYI